MLIKKLFCHNKRINFTFLKGFSLKDDKSKKIKDCDIIPHVEKFFINILKENTKNFKYIVEKSNVKKSMDFLLKMFQINEKIIKDDNIRNDTMQMIYEIESNLDDKDTYIKVMEIFTPLFCEFPSNDLLKDLMLSFKKKSYLFNDDDTDNIISSLEKIKRKNAQLNLNEYDEVKNKLLENNPDPNHGSNEHLKHRGMDTLKNIEVSISHKRNKVTIRSKKFFPRIRLIGLNDYSYSSVYDSIRYLEHESPNIVIFQKRPVYDMGFHDKHLGMLDSSLLKEFNSEVLSDKSRFILSDVEKLVWENKENIKAPSFVYTIIYRTLYQLNKFNNIKVYFSDLPLFNEIDILIKKHTHIEETRDFFTYAKLNYLMEKYIWLTKKCKKHCPSCTGERMEHPHHNIEDVLNYQDFFIQEKYDFIADNIVKVLLSNLDEPYIYAFVDKKNLFILAQLLSIKLDGLNDYSPMQETFDYNYGKLTTSFEECQSLNKDTREVYINKLALFSSLYVDTLKIPEMKNVEKEFPEFMKLHYKYKEKLNFVDDLKVWKSRKFDAKCFPTHLMINKFLNKK